MEERLEEILKLLSKQKNFLTGNQICTGVGVSTKTLRNDIKTLNYLLKDKGAEIRSEKAKGYILDIYDKDKFNSLINKSIEENFSDYINQDGRTKAIIIRLLQGLINNEESITQRNLSDELFISLSTLKNDLKEAKILMNEYFLEINKNSNKGLIIEGSEKNIRNAMVDFLFKEDYNFNFQLPQKNIINKEKIVEILKNKLEENNVNLTDTSFNSLVKRIIITLVRMKGNHIINLTVEDIEEIKSLNEISISNSVCDEIEEKLEIELMFIERVYITQYLASSQLIIKNTQDNLDNGSECLDIFVRSILFRLYEKTGFNFTGDNILLKLLADHLKASMNRYKFKVEIKNEMLNIIKNNYPVAFNLAVITSDFILKDKDIVLNEHEIGFIALHLAAAMERMDINYKQTVKKVIIVCSTGFGTSLLLKAKLEKYFAGRIKVVDTLPLYQVDERQIEENDLIISTIPMPDFNSEKIILISNLLNEEERLRVDSFITNTDLDNNELKKYFNKEFFFNDKEFTLKYEVIDFLTEQLIKKNQITEKTKQAIFSREQLSTTEIGNLVAIPHIIGSEIKESIITVAILKKPIVWYKTKVSVVLLICLSKEQYSVAKTNLENLYKKIMNINNVYKIIKCKKFDEFIKIII